MYSFNLILHFGIIINGNFSSWTHLYLDGKFIQNVMVKFLAISYSLFLFHPVQIILVSNKHSFLGVTKMHLKHWWNSLYASTTLMFLSKTLDCTAHLLIEIGGTSHSYLQMVLIENNAR